MTGLGKTRSAPTENSTGARNTIVTCDECESRLVVTLEKDRRPHSASDTYAGCPICGNAIPVTQIPGAGPSDRVCDVEALDDDEELDRPYDDLDHAPENIELSENGDANDGRDEIVAAIEGSLETADLDYVSGTVRLEFQWMDIEVDGCYRSSRELRAEVGLFAARLAERMRLPLARLDLSDLVAAALEGSEVDALLASAPLGRDAQILVTVEDLAKLSESSRIRLDLEEINDAIIRELAVRPHLMYELHPRKFEQLVAELFRDMGYDVVLTPPSGDGGRDIKAFRKDACGTLLTLIECKRYSRIHPVYGSTLWVWRSFGRSTVCWSASVRRMRSSRPRAGSQRAREPSSRTCPFASPLPTTISLRAGAEGTEGLTGGRPHATVTGRQTPSGGRSLSR